MEDNPFPELKIDDFSFLNSTEKRERCSKCNRSRKYYCYTCYKPVNDFIADRIPKVKLPVKIDVIKHPSEVDGKSTSPHAAILASDDVTIYDYPCIPTYDPSKVITILIFPGPKSCDLEDVLGLKKCNSETSKHNCETSKRSSETSKGNSGTIKSNSEASKTICKVTPWFDKVVFIDSTWNQTPTIANDERLKDINRVEIKLRKTKFWRTQDGNPDEYLSTIEAIYYFLTDYHGLCINPIYSNEYDNLLFFFCFNYNKIRQASGGGKTIKAYSKKKKNEGILNA
ncbi:hypothetical protein LOTGIDRAFT_129117 [Lottia gigantea]|uniref:tRNA-uridine aminocarboxypropyltransferase 1 n=1 Tax=Lottia gigantea TaxID=225164 RepID=V3Z6P2_LOTGI|nr:hypothetical protein LOTGIDRAFT_129117 [Lottia gigantea]ESO86453.1 hypothetical protein LOTGIDRAFT_129117 [Lottia gigantea]